MKVKGVSMPIPMLPVKTSSPLIKWKDKGSILHVGLRERASPKVTGLYTKVNGIDYEVVPWGTAGSKDDSMENIYSAVDLISDPFMSSGAYVANFRSKVISSPWSQYSWSVSRGSEGLCLQVVEPYILRLYRVPDMNTPTNRIQLHQVSGVNNTGALIHSKYVTLGSKTFDVHGTEIDLQVAYTVNSTMSIALWEANGDRFVLYGNRNSRSTGTMYKNGVLFFNNWYGLMDVYSPYTNLDNITYFDYSTKQVCTLSRAQLKIPSTSAFETVLRRDQYIWTFDWANASRILYVYNIETQTSTQIDLGANFYLHKARFIRTLAGDFMLIPSGPTRSTSSVYAYSLMVNLATYEVISLSDLTGVPGPFIVGNDYDDSPSFSGTRRIKEMPSKCWYLIFCEWTTDYNVTKPLYGTYTGKDLMAFPVVIRGGILPVTVAGLSWYTDTGSSFGYEHSYTYYIEDRCFNFNDYSYWHPLYESCFWRYQQGDKYRYTYEGMQ
jgi:hypothetical protein